MLHFKCKDIGMDCPYETEAPTKDYLMLKIKKHARNMHNMSDIPENVEKKIQKAITGH